MTAGESNLFSCLLLRHESQYDQRRRCHRGEECAGKNHVILQSNSLLPLKFSTVFRRGILIPCEPSGGFVTAMPSPCHVDSIGQDQFQKQASNDSLLVHLREECWEGIEESNLFRKRRQCSVHGSKKKLKPFARNPI